MGLRVLVQRLPVISEALATRIVEVPPRQTGPALTTLAVLVALDAGVVRAVRVHELEILGTRDLHTLGKLVPDAEVVEGRHADLVFALARGGAEQGPRSLPKLDARARRRRVGHGDRQRIGRGQTAAEQLRRALHHQVLGSAAADPQPHRLEVLGRERRTDERHRRAAARRRAEGRRRELVVQEAQLGLGRLHPLQQAGRGRLTQQLVVGRPRAQIQPAGGREATVAELVGALIDRAVEDHRLDRLEGVVEAPDVGGVALHGWAGLAGRPRRLEELRLQHSQVQEVDVSVPVQVPIGIGGEEQRLQLAQVEEVDHAVVVQVRVAHVPVAVAVGVALAGVRDEGAVVHGVVEAVEVGVVHRVGERRLRSQDHGRRGERGEQDPGGAASSRGETSARRAVADHGIRSRPRGAMGAAKQRSPSATAPGY